MRILSILTLSVFLYPSLANGRGLLIPKDENLPPLAMLKHQVKIQLEDQVAVTEIEQVFRNHTSRQLEATYTFPVPKGASVNSFSMDINGAKVQGEMMDAKQARSIYTSIVQRAQDPGLLEYLGKRLFRVRVFPIPPNGDQKLTLRFTAIAEREKDMVEYIYPLKTKGKALKTLESFSIQAKLKSKDGIQNIHSPSHNVEIKRESDTQVTVSYEETGATLDRDFQLFYQLSNKDIGMSTLFHRPISEEPGYFLMMLTPKLGLLKKNSVPRDMVFVLDTSGSMRGAKIDQAKNAVQYCLESLNPEDRFSILQFASTVNPYASTLKKASKEQIVEASKWVQGLNATGGTAIDEALANALDLRSKEKSRTFTVLFFTDGLPTIGETNPKKILKNTLSRNNSQTRIFTFGVGNDVNAVLLDELADETHALAGYVRPSEQIDTKVARFYDKIRHPVLTGLKLEVDQKQLTLLETFPRRLPDLFHGGQLTVFGRYRGDGHTAVKLTGQVGSETKEFIYEVTFPKKPAEDRDFVEHLWARRKVGYLLDQIRVNGEQKELKDEVVQLAKRYGITTPYTSYLVVPDSTVMHNHRKNVPPPPGAFKRVPDVRFAPGGGLPGGGSGFGGRPAGPTAGSGGRGIGSGIGGIAGLGGGIGGLPSGNPRGTTRPSKTNAPKPSAETTPSGDSKETPKLQQSFDSLEFARRVTKQQGGLEQQRLAYLNLQRRGDAYTYQQSLQRLKEGKADSGKLGVDLSLANRKLRQQGQVDAKSRQTVATREMLLIGQVWIDSKFTEKTKAVMVKGFSEAYFAILSEQPTIKEVYQLGNAIIWITPSGSALVIDPTKGKTKMKVEEIKKLFIAKK